MRIMFLFSVLLLFVALTPPARSTLGRGSRLCGQLHGACREDSCYSIEEKIGHCTKYKLCCRKWWLSSFLPTPQPDGKTG
ncbi:beta-defensin 130B-like [Dromiciops gliroides]|uniref:beta-defensin 130B-like n=1 Tax=Dromiciops gliroides TaxID=33562 RepID=UPI001CC4450A|nr:beta-defensin 130B-like [Dromiciops gliroides]